MRKMCCIERRRVAAPRRRVSTISIEPRDPVRKILEKSRAAVTIEEPDDQTRKRKGCVLCIHGAPGSVFDWRYLSPELTLRGYRVVRMDLPGHGLTKRSALRDPENGSARSMCSYVRDVMKELGTEILTEKPVLVGHSMGTETVVELATQSLTQKELNVGGIALICPIGRRPHRGLTAGISTKNMSVFFMPILKCFGPLKEKIAKLFSVYAFGFATRTPPEEFYWMFQRASQVDFKRNASNLDKLASASFPTLVCHGTSDPLMEPTIHREVLDGWIENSYVSTTSAVNTTKAAKDKVRVTSIQNFCFATFVGENHYVGLKGSVSRVVNYIDRILEQD
jgi:pimeloyl-ACP methyl ester carboxylesterase